MDERRGAASLRRGRCGNSDGASGNYLTAVNGGGVGGPNDGSAPIHTDATAIAEWERLRLNFLPGARVTIRVPNGRFLTAVNGGGIRGSSASSIVTTDAVRPAAWETFTLVRLDNVSGGALKPAPSPPPKWGTKLTSAELAVITQHFGKHPSYHVGVSRSGGFPEVLRVERYVDDAGYMPLGIIVDGTWVESGVYGVLWSPAEATRRVLTARAAGRVSMTAGARHWRCVGSRIHCPPVGAARPPRRRVGTHPNYRSRTATSSFGFG